MELKRRAGTAPSLFLVRFLNFANPHMISNSDSCVQYYTLVLTGDSSYVSGNIQIHVCGYTLVLTGNSSYVSGNISSPF